MTLLEIKTAAASYLDKAVADLTVNGQDLGLVAMNQARLAAELLHDFNFQRKLLTVTVNTVTGGSLDTAVLYGTATVADIKTIVDIGQFDENGEFRPKDWTTFEDSTERQRSEGSQGGDIRYPTDGQYVAGVGGRRRFTILNNTLYSFPVAETGENMTVAIDAFTFAADWTSLATTDIWTTKGSQYLLWQTIIHLNYKFEAFVPRQEGRLSPPQLEADKGLEALKSWDVFKYEQNRRHNRG